jgi:hypothetical protein
MSTPVRRAIYGKLAADTTLNGMLGSPAPSRAKSIYHSQAPDGSSFPFVVIQKQSGVPTEAFSDPSAMDTDIWMVKGIVHDTGADVAEAIAARINVLLNDAALSISGASLLYLRRQSDVEYPEVDDGEMYWHCGALFRLVTD